MSDGHLPTVMVQQSEMNSLYPSGGNFSLQVQDPQTYMTVSSDVTAGQAQVLATPECAVGFLPAGQASASHGGDYKPTPTEAANPSCLGDVYDVFPNPSVPTVVPQDKIISFQQTPKPDIASLYQATLENYPSVTVSEPQLPMKNGACPGGKTAKPEVKEVKQLYACEQCQATFRRFSNLKIHLQRHLGNKPFACRQCSAAFVEEKNLMRHMVAHRTDRPHVCQECGLAFVESGNLTRHMLTHSGSKDFVCDICGATFSKSHHLKDHLVSHKESHDSRRENVCEECQNVFNNPFQLRKHIKSVHSGGNGRPYSCPQCGAKFGWWNIFRRHLLTHKGLKPFVCEKCDEAFSDNLALRQHKRKHARNKNNACHVCEAAFDRPSHLVRHMRSHTGEKPNVCAECGAAFLERNKLARHMRIHSGAVGGVVCELCGARFTHTRHLTHHMKSHQDLPTTRNDATWSHSEKKFTVPGNKKRQENGLMTTREKKRKGALVVKYFTVSVDTKKWTDSTKEQDSVSGEDADSFSAEDSQNQSADSVAGNRKRKGGEQGRRRSRRKWGEPKRDGDVNTPSQGKERRATNSQDPRDKKNAVKREAKPAGHSTNKGRKTRGRSTCASKKRKRAISSRELDDDETDESAEIDAPSVPVVDARSNSKAQLSWGGYLRQHRPLGSIPAPVAPADQGDSLPCHLQQQQEGQKVGFVLYACQQCSAVFNSAFSLKLHKRVHKTRVSVCLRCGDVFKGSSDLAQHHDLCTGFLPLKSDSDLSTPQLPGSSLSNGDRPTERKPHGCHLCGTSFDQVNKLKLHMQFHTDSRKHVCNECGASFSKSTDLRAHIRTHTGDRPFVCSVCGASYTQSSTLSVHMKTHSGIKPHVCKVCGAAFPRNGRLKAHMRCHSGEKPCVCKLCGAAFKWSQTLLRHMNTEHSSTTFACQVCSETFPNEKQLKAHQQVHSGERPHACPQCNKAFKKLVQLRRHSHVHTGKWPFLCEECGAGFGSAASLKIHVRCHTGEKPFVCEECGQAFRISSHLRRHIASHTDDPIYVKRQPLGKTVAS